MAEITELLGRSHDGDASAIQALMPLVYNRLGELAHHQLAKEAGPRTWGASCTARRRRSAFQFRSRATDRRSARRPAKRDCVTSSSIRAISENSPRATETPFNLVLEARP